MLIETRARTDVKIDGEWLIFPVSSIVLWVAFGVAIALRSGTFAIGALGVAGFAASSGLSYLVYSLVNRRNLHFRRDQELLWNVTSALRSTTRPDDLKTSLPLGSAEQNLSLLTQGERERSATLWGLMVLLPYSGWAFLFYVLYFLSEDFKKHGRSEGLVLEDIERTLKGSVSLSLSPESWSFPSHNSALYLILSILTLGVFALYWLYVSTKDPALHFDFHARIEDQLFRSPFAFSGSTAAGA